MNEQKVKKFLHKLASQNCPDWCASPAGDDGMWCNACIASHLLEEDHEILKENTRQPGHY